MKVSKQILGIAAISALFAVSHPEARAASTITFTGGQNNIDFGAFTDPSFSTTPATALCPGGTMTGICASGGTGIFLNYTGYAALNDDTAIFVTTVAGPALSGGTPDSYAKAITGHISNFKVFGGGGTEIFVNPLGGLTGEGYTVRQAPNVFARSLALQPIPVEVIGTFGTRSGNVVFNSFYGNYDSATGGATYSFDHQSIITLTVDDPSQVPGPLPLLGAGMAFGFSRRLRKRTKLAVK